MKYLIPILITLIVIAIVWDRHFTNLRIERCAESKTKIVMVYGKARACPEGGV